MTKTPRETPNDTPASSQHGAVNSGSGTGTTTEVRISRTKCPVCGRPTEARYRPFCSRRCTEVDLGHWLTERYVVPGNPALDED